MKKTILKYLVMACCLIWTTVSYGQVISEVAGSTTTVMPNNGDLFTDPGDGTNGGPGGNCSTTSSGDLGDYPNCNCITVTTLTAPTGGQVSVTFNTFRVFGNFDWLTIFDGSGAVTATNGNGSATNPTSGDTELWNSSVDGDELIDMTNAGMVTFTSTNGSLTFASRFSGVVNTCGWEAAVAVTGGPPPPPPAAAFNHPDAGLTENFTVACGAALTNYFDNGGEDCDGTGLGSYQNNDPGSVAIICPDAMGQPITLEFLEVDIETRSTAPCWDFLNIYDGMGTGGTQLFSGCGEEGFQSCSGFPGDGSDGGGIEGGPNDLDGSNDATPVNNIWTSTDASGCLTVEFTSDGSVDQGGWIATLGCDAIPGVGCGIVCPADIEVPCESGSSPAITGTATAGADCTVAFTDEVIGCAVTRTWTATAASGEITSCVQNITLIDDSSPVITCPPGQTLTCFETIPTPVTSAADFVAAGGTISDNCTSSIDDFSIFSQDANNGGDNCPGNATVVTRTYFVSDFCGNVTTCTQTFTYNASAIGPVITSVLPTCFKYCASLANPMDADITFTTDCSFGATINITGPTQIGQDNCPGTIYRYTYTVTDDCNRTSAPVTRDFIIGNEGPTINCAPFNLVLDCGDPNNQDYIDTYLGSVTANSSCELGVNVTNNLQANFANTITCNTARTVIFTATDDCGRSTTCSSQITIWDVTPPELTSTYMDGVCNEAVCGSDLNFFYNFWKDKVIEGLTATDACDSNVSIQAVGPFSPNQNCPDETTETVVAFVATDNCGNESQIEYSFFVNAADDAAPLGAIMGAIATEEAETVESVSITLDGNSNVLNMTTAADGLYGFNELEEGFNYEVSPYSNQDPLNGISSYDLVLISKHILQMETLDSPYKLIAADVNKSGSITTMDLVDLRKVILHIDEEFANNTSWRFVESNFVFPDVTNPFATIFPEKVSINGLTLEETHDFVAVKIGDVNGSVVANAMAGADDRTTVGDLVFNVADQELVAGNTYEVAFQANAFNNIHGYQFTMNFDQSVLEVVDVKAGDLNNMTEANFGMTKLSQGAITTSWTSQEAQNLTRDANVFYVSFTAKADGMLSEVLSVNSRYTAAEAYDANLDLMNVELRFGDVESIASELRLYQNTPNPFNQETVIGFDLPQDANVMLNIYDGSGKLVKQVEGNFAKGYNNVSLSKGELAPGLLHYQLVTPMGTATKKMIVQ
ncbi:MAG: cohesin domain-containing protein [Saprospiraceae bacterium]